MRDGLQKFAFAFLVFIALGTVLGWDMPGLALAQEAAQPPATTLQVIQSNWTPDLITALFAGIERILTAIGVLIVTVVGVWLQIRNNRKQGEKIGNVRDEKLEAIHSTTTTVVGQLNGERTALLAEIAGLKRIIAERGERKADVQQADLADLRVSAQVATSAFAKPIVAEAERKVAAATEESNK